MSKCKKFGRAQREKYIELGKMCQECDDTNEDVDDVVEVDDTDSKK